MASLNKVLLIGNLTRDPELKQTTAGKSVCTFSIAVNRPYAKDNQQNVDFIDVITWEKTADFVATYFTKGTPIFVMGQLQIRTWKDKNDQFRSSTEIVAEEVSFVQSKGSEDFKKNE